MIGLDWVVELRRNRLKPNAVFLQMREFPIAEVWTHDGIVTVQVLPADNIEAADLRPLAGLSVIVEDFSEQPTRHRQLVAAVARVKPALLAMPILSERGLVLHTLQPTEPPTSRTFTA